MREPSTDAAISLMIATTKGQMVRIGVRLESQKDCALWKHQWQYRWWHMYSRKDSFL